MLAAHSRHVQSKNPLEESGRPAPVKLAGPLALQNGRLYARWGGEQDWCRLWCTKQGRLVMGHCTCREGMLDVLWCDHLRAAHEALASKEPVAAEQEPPPTLVNADKLRQICNLVSPLQLPLMAQICGASWSVFLVPEGLNVRVL